MKFLFIVFLTFLSLSCQRLFKAKKRKTNFDLSRRELLSPENANAYVWKEKAEADTTDRSIQPVLALDSFLTQTVSLEVHNMKLHILLHELVEKGYIQDLVYDYDRKTSEPEYSFEVHEIPLWQVLNLLEHHPHNPRSLVSPITPFTVFVYVGLRYRTEIINQK